VSRSLRTLAVIVPTRNRSQLAINTVRSVLAQGLEHVRVIVAENSTDEAERARVRAFCEEHQAARVNMVHPDAPLPMAQNWDFALESALRYEDVTHALILSDRMLAKPGELRVLYEAVRDHPEHVLLYTEDRAYDDGDPVRLVQTRWTGKLVEVPAARLLYNASIMHLHPAPRLMNCVTPRHVFDAVRARFGTITGSAAPDYAFAYRCLEVVDTLHYFDRAPVVYYAWLRSNGHSFARGVHTGDSADFLKNLAPLGRLNGYAPIPELITVVNSIAHEYCKVQQETGSAKFPPLDRDAYLLANEVEIRRDNLNPEMRAELLGIIEKQERFQRRPSLFRFIQRVLSVRDVRPLRPLWRFLAQYPRLQPPGDSPVPVPSTRAALEMVARRPRRRHLSSLHLRVLLGDTKTVGRYVHRAGGEFPPALQL
jgi:hypothetical protein